MTSIKKIFIVLGVLVASLGLFFATTAQASQSFWEFSVPDYGTAPWTGATLQNSLSSLGLGSVGLTDSSGRATTNYAEWDYTYYKIPPGQMIGDGTTRDNRDCYGNYSGCYPAGPTTKQEAQAAEAAHSVGSLLLWFGFSWELVKYYGYGQASENVRNLMLSLWWIAYASVLMIFGALAKVPIYKRIALGIFVLAILKVFLYDALNLETAYRIVSFIVLGVILLIVSYSYQKNKGKITKFLGGDGQSGKI